jgi:hypothetical protein
LGGGVHYNFQFQIGVQRGSCVFVEKLGARGRESTKHGPLVLTGSMDPLYGPGPWTPSMGRIFPNFIITVKHDSTFQFLKIF